MPDATPLAASAPTEALLDVLVKRLREAGPFEPIRVRSAADLAEVRQRIAGAILLNGTATRDFTLLAHLQAVGEDLPFIVIGGEPPYSVSGVSCWLGALPPPSMLKAMLEELVPMGASRAWSVGAFSEEEPPSQGGPKSVRRKADMILGESRATRKLLHDLDRVARSAAIVLITGESGTGKELVARALHYGGQRSLEPFIAVNCAAIPETLFEAELFGYQRGAFTGAVASRAGAFEAAQGGTLFLDEIGEMPRAMQPKLLRVLETKEITRLGSNEPRKVQARVVVATNRDLEVEIREGNFREDLYYRLNVFPLHVAPLRHRLEDIPPIVAHHLGMLAAREGRPTPRVTPAALERLLGHAWPGNVRELVHLLSRAVLVAPGNVIDAEHLHLPESPEHVSVTRYRDAKQRFEQEYYARLMGLANGNITLAARLADKTRKEVYDALKRLDVDLSPYRSAERS